jgi:hypothetical protein
MYNSDLPTRAELPSSRQLLRSTIIAIIVATVLLVTVVLPSEYGIDPTGIGRVLGLTQMGEIKTELAAEAARDRTADASGQTSGTSQQPPVKQGTDASVLPAKTAPSAEQDSRTDEMTITLKPGQGAEIKLEMVKGAKASYEWTTSGGPVNHDTHGDGPGGVTHSFSKGRQMERDSGELTAPFDGNHGWFWRNRTETDVTVTLKTKGNYRNIKRVV